MSRYISETLRTLVAKNAQFRCEYCLIFERHSIFPFHIEHIISLKHGGSSEIENLAFSCPDCNYNKGTDIATFVDESDKLSVFFHPRKDKWVDHFEIKADGIIISKTDIGTATLNILGLNLFTSVEQRRILIEKNKL